MTKTILLCSGVYQPAGASIPPVVVICQLMQLNGTNYVWIDGVSKTEPLLLPSHLLVDHKRLGTLRDYLLDERHFALGEQFVNILELNTEQDATPTVLVRAIEMMHSDGISAAAALEAATAWGWALHALDQADRIAYQAALEPVSASPASDPAAI